MKRFSPTASQASQLADVGNDDAISHCGGVTLKVRQTLGDDKTIYIILDIVLPETMPLDELVMKNPSGDTNHHVVLKDTWVGPVSLSYKDIAGKSFRDAVRGLNILTGFSCSVNNVSIDFVTNTITYLMCYTPQVEAEEGKPLTIMIGGIEQLTELGMRLILEGPFVISWIPKYTPASSHTYDIRDGAEVIGSVTISPFSLQGEINRFQYETYENFIQSISLTFKDGKTYMPELKCSTGGYSRDLKSGAADFVLQFCSILLLDDVDAIHIGGYTLQTH